jgi:hypothetical protein
MLSRSIDCYSVKEVAMSTDPRIYTSDVFRGQWIPFNVGAGDCEDIYSIGNPAYMVMVPTLKLKREEEQKQNAHHH